MIHARVLIVKILRLFKVNRIIAKIYYKYIHGFNPAIKELPEVIEKCFNKAVELKTVENGDYFEFGIFKGYTFAYANNYGKKIKLKNMRYFGFDSFKGLPEVVGLDVTRDMPFYKGQYYAPKAKVVKDLENTGIDWSKAHLVDGFFCDTLSDESREKFNMGNVSVALIDCDLYSSTKEVLDFIKDMIIDNSILIFDDWNTFNSDNERGQRKAFKDFLYANDHITATEYFSYGVYGIAFIISVIE